MKKNHNLTLIKNMIESILNKKTNGKMFNIVTATWNPVSGCLYNCNYCWARDLAITKLKNSHRYSQGFKPRINESEFKSKYGKGDVIWESMEHIIGAPSDIIINFPTACIPRAIETPQCLDKFYGDHSWYEARDDREKCLTLYMNKLAKRFYELREKTPYVEPIRVGNHSYFYDIILLCKYGDYVDVWGNYLKNRWNWQKPEEMANLLDYLKGRLRRMDFFNDLKQEVTLIQKKRSTKVAQAGKEAKDMKMSDYW